MSPIRAMEWAIAMGILHHLVFQFPQQAPIFSTLFGFLIENISVYLALTWDTNTLSGLGIAQQLALFNAVEFTVILLLKVIYNVYFRHRGIPTRFRWAATDLAYWRAYASGHGHTQVEALHKQIGDIVRLQPNHISFSSLEAVEAIHGVRTKTRKGEVYETVMRHTPTAPLTLFSETWISSDDADSVTRNDTAFFDELQILYSEYCSLFISGVTAESQKNGGVIDITKWIDNLTFDVSGALSLGEDFNALRDIDGSNFEVISDRWMYVSRVYAIPWFVPIWWLGRLSKGRKKTLSKYEKWISEASRKASEDTNPTRKTLIRALLTATDPETGKGLSTADNFVVAMGFIIAASDTTGASLTFVLYHLLVNPHVWERVCEEIRSTFKSPEDMNGQSTAKLPYLDAVIHEGIRLRPAAPSNLVRETPPEGMVIAGHYIPANTKVSTPIWTILHDERHFSNPNKFIPERWLDSERGDETCNKAAFLPFSTGLRNCIGRPLALLEMRLLISLFVWHFDAKLVSEQEPFYEDRFVARRGSLFVSVERRKT